MASGKGNPYHKKRGTTGGQFTSQTGEGAGTSKPEGIDRAIGRFGKRKPVRRFAGKPLPPPEKKAPGWEQRQLDAMAKIDEKNAEDIEAARLQREDEEAGGYAGAAEREDAAAKRERLLAAGMDDEVEKMDRATASAARSGAGLPESQDEGIKLVSGKPLVGMGVPNPETMRRDAENRKVLERFNAEGPKRRAEMQRRVEEDARLKAEGKPFTGVTHNRRGEAVKVTVPGPDEVSQERAAFAAAERANMRAAAEMTLKETRGQFLRAVETQRGVKEAARAYQDARVALEAQWSPTERDKKRRAVAKELGHERGLDEPGGIVWGQDVAKSLQDRFTAPRAGRKLGAQMGGVIRGAARVAYGEGTPEEKARWRREHATGDNSESLRRMETAARKAAGLPDEPTIVPQMSEAEKNVHLERMGWAKAEQANRDEAARVTRRKAAFDALTKWEAQSKPRSRAAGPGFGGQDTRNVDRIVHAGVVRNIVEEALGLIGESSMGAEERSRRIAERDSILREYRKGKRAK